MKKRFVSAFIAFIICISFVVPVGAAEPVVYQLPNNITINISNFTDEFNTNVGSLPFDPELPENALVFASFTGATTINFYCLFPNRSYTFSYYQGVYNLIGYVCVVSYQYGSRRLTYYDSGLGIPSGVVFLYSISNLPPTPPSPPYEPEHTYNPFGFDIQDFTEWLQLHPEFKVSLQKNFPWLKFDSADDVYKFLQWWDAYGQSAEEMERHVDELINHNMIYPDADVRFSADMLGSLSTQTLKQYYKYQESLKPKDQFVPDPVPPSVITDPSISVPNPSDPLDTSLLREIIRLLVLQINNDSSYYTGLVNAINELNVNINNSTPILNNINNLLGGAGGIGGIAGAINNINVKLGDYIDSLPSVPSVTDEEFWRMMLIPDFHDFDEFQDQFIEKFPVITQLDSVPDPDQILIGSGSAVQLASASSDDYEANEQFSFTAPETFANGAFTNIDIPIVDFSKFSLAIAAFKGIISVFALSIFSKWLFNFAPSLLNGR